MQPTSAIIPASLTAACAANSPDNLHHKVALGTFESKLHCGTHVSSTGQTHRWDPDFPHSDNMPPCGNCGGGLWIPRSREQDVPQVARRSRRRTQGPRQWPESPGHGRTGDPPAGHGVYYLPWINPGRDGHQRARGRAQSSVRSEVKGHKRPTGGLSPWRLLMSIVLHSVVGFAAGTN